ncbi:hypothetical protein P280DRAFT_425577 [Massarina eburnea CBS 473.64]|uniref:Uncharacterized protein n=1 Tax=Massarina eburnea CBS 473.64 TaxID=1395130 RepID=A0A6A6S3K1_9PLEO|nr:hypothetical protein P280DRAFT_425577 [Massarina eburnea CBS 473.64]
MPADRRPAYPVAKPMKTERTHEENQERAYIAASRRSDRSLEARIESARRASEIHKKRTGRALRVTEQDVINEEMYEEEDDDLPTQYQRLNAHLQTSSWLFNRKLHDYIATQHGVRNMFLHQQFPGHTMPSYGTQFQANGQMPMMNQHMLPPQTFSPVTQGFAQPPQPYSPQGPQQQGYRQAPYSIPPRQHLHQRSASIPTPLALPSASATVPQINSAVTTPQGDFNRRLSLPPSSFDPNPPSVGEPPPRPPVSRSTTAQGMHHQPVSPRNALSRMPSASNSGHVTPKVKSEHDTPTSYRFTPLPFNSSSQVIDTNPLSLSLPPESQQIVGSALDPNDPRTAILMAGSDNLPQPFYTYNPNLSPKSGRKATDQLPPSGAGMTQTLAPENSVKAEKTVDNLTSNSPPSTMMDNFYSPSLFTPTGFGYSNYFDQNQEVDSNRVTSDGLFNDQYEDNSFVNWDQ